ncbi:head GIN domain-containing protein [Hymenobacter sp. DG01]|uniref:head GIN domain-containing protein n=1 Tax=Hymenobacter sp. DG01 TaxID=2584940 RepID=UPI00111F3E61|nr:head GIN domain-containing protein [Hymenobacter sp. DG01]
MKILRLLVPGLLVAVLMLSAFRAQASREVRWVGAFTSVGLGGSMRVVLRQGSPQKVEVEGDVTDLSHLATIVSNGRLHINTKKEGYFSSYNYKGNVTVYVTMPTIKGLAVGGSGSIRAADPIRADRLDLAVSGSGSIQLSSVTANKIDSSLSGSGSIQAAGVAPDLDISVSGSGGVQAPKLQSKTCSVSISGSGNCRVQATERLEASIVGSGDVYVTGNPQVKSSVVGSGRVHRE